ncbi:phosphoribosylaminoimidazole-succinocarboxamide synthase [Desulfonauticus submarinus]|uniref:Phosphoribosylaminoimidazole-succinocarboxamide synthase n=1 Tax=Desulfonauticus submarinus TaxID=206665 RepID=A0A1H0FXL5_9BACT|nr:phosphoribosylaminoimidazolesuccinocarboxamide synthase [Desulfonauticus submarinus]SDN99229.1 phosphoribosylaminoimidazole-succinocarboxamide synthase [Desulfonauticus submarinus]
MKVVKNTSIQEYPLFSKGKVRDIYELNDDQLLIITTDRMSAFDVILPDPIPFKGVVLNQLTIFWMNKFSSIVENHLIETEVKKFPAPLQKYAEELEGRSVIVRKAKPLPIECIVRGYITGSGWKDYIKTGKVCGHVLPKDLKKSEKLPNPIFTPSTKAELGEHDENITLSQAKAKIGEVLLNTIEEISLTLYSKAQEYAWDRGIIIADTKFEFGIKDKKIYLIDEVLTPDSSRFWPKETYTPGKDQPSFDKQYLRDWLTNSGWDKTPPGPKLPPEVIEQTQKKYLQAYEFLTGKTL